MALDYPDFDDPLGEEDPSEGLEQESVTNEDPGSETGVGEVTNVSPEQRTGIEIATPKSPQDRLLGDLATLSKKDRADASAVVAPGTHSQKQIHPATALFNRVGTTSGKGHQLCSFQDFD